MLVQSWHQGRTKGGIVAQFKVPVHGNWCLLRIDLVGVSIGLGHCVQRVRVRPDGTGNRRKGLATDRPLCNSTSDDAPEQAPEEIPLTEPTLEVLRKRGMVGQRIAQIEATEPALRQVLMHLIAQPPFRPRAKGVAYHQH